MRDTYVPQGWNDASLTHCWSGNKQGCVKKLRLADLNLNEIKNFVFHHENLAREWSMR